MRRTVLLALGLASLLAGCAQTVWVRPGTTQAEAQLVVDQCDYASEFGTSPTTIRYGGRHTFGKDLAASLAEGLMDGVRKASLMSKCMRANGFVQQTVPPAPSIQIASVPPAPPALPAADAPSPPILNPTTDTELLRQSGPSVPVALASASADMRRVLPAQTESLQGLRQLVTQRLMELPDHSKSKMSFLLGACSAGDMTACIMADALEPGRPAKLLSSR